MKITVYTISTCPFSQQEKDYLASNKLTFEEKNIEEHREFLAEMLKTSDEFAGVPFTVVEKDDGSKVNLKGFTKEEFDKELGLVQAKQEPAMSMANAGIKVPPPAPPAAPTAPTPPPPPPVAPATSDVAPPADGPLPPPAVTEQTTPPPAPVSPPTPEPLPTPDESLKSVIENLQQKTEAPAASQPSAPTEIPPASSPSTATGLPKIPDFPGK